MVYLRSRLPDPIQFYLSFQSFFFNLWGFTDFPGESTRSWNSSVDADTSYVRSGNVIPESRGTRDHLWLATPAPRVLVSEC